MRYRRNMGSHASIFSSSSIFCGCDVDIIVGMPPDLFQMVHMKEELEDLLVHPVDLIRYHRYLNPNLRRRIDRDVIYI